MLINIEPQVSVVMACFNEHPYFLELSLRSLMRQSFANFECIVIDDSTDAGVAKLCKYICNSDPRFRYIHTVQKIGLAASLNLGIKLAKADLIVRFDSDDICRHDRLAVQIKFLNENPGISVLGSAVEIINFDGKKIGERLYPILHEEIQKKFVFSSAVAHPTVIFRKKVFDELGCVYDTSFSFSEDLDLWLRLLNKGVKFANLPDALVQHRRHHTSRHKSHWKFNVKTRLINISRPYVIRKLICIFGLVIWAYLPRDVQHFLFRFIQLRGQ